MRDLDGRTALITGGSRGIGRDAALALAREGVSVAITYRDQRAAAESVCEAVRALGGASCTALQVDVRDPAAIRSMVATAERALGAIDILVNNAGIAVPRDLDTLTEDDWHDAIATNLTSAFLVIQAVLPGMRQRGWGRIINLSSVAAQIGGVVGPHYAASKAGLHGLTHGYARFLAGKGITVNAIAPALIETDMVKGLPQAAKSLIPVGRLGTVDEVSDIVLLLARNGYITGQTINVNGGMYMS
jgi:3-oxoacyl-[acyl-carrier protein] reductase